MKHYIIFSTLKMEAMFSSETSVHVYWKSRCHNRKVLSIMTFFSDFCAKNTRNITYLLHLEHESSVFTRNVGAHPSDFTLS
jgi:hypothetical protein